MLNKFLSAVIITAVTFCFFTQYNSAFAQNKATPRVQGTPVLLPADTEESENFNPFNDPERIKARVENQIKRLTTDFDLSDDQANMLLQIYLENEQQQLELKARINQLAQERQERFESILTPDQKEKYQKTKIERKDRERTKPPSAKDASEIKKSPGREGRELQR